MTLDLHHGDDVDLNNPLDVANQSFYYSSEHVPEDMKKSDFSILHINIRSLQKNFDSFQVLLNSLDHRFSIIALSETWLKTDPHSYYFLPGYQLIVNNRKGMKAGGGVALYVSSDLNFTVREDLNLSNESLESLFIEVINQNVKNIISGVVYKAIITNS